MWTVPLKSLWKLSNFKNEFAWIAEASEVPVFNSNARWLSPGFDVSA